MVKCIAYNGGYKYQLKEAYTVCISITPPDRIDTEYILLELTGEMTIKRGYAWDGPSGPTIDTRSFMRGSLIHDALYQLMREGHLDRAVYREAADRVLRDICMEDGMCSIRAWWVYRSVRRYGDPAADPANKHPIIYAPKGCQR